MRMLSVIAAGAALSLSVPALAETAETLSFQHDGYTYVYQVEVKDGSRFITGRAYPGGAKFSLQVRNGKVDGSFNVSSVDFRVSDAVGAAVDMKPAELSMR